MIDMPTQEVYDLALLALGAGSGPLVGTQLRRFGLPVSPELAALGVGLVVFFFGDRVHRAVKLIGAGLAAGAGGFIISRYLAGLQPKPPTIGAPAPAAMNPAEAAAQAYVNTQRFLD